MYIAWNWLHPIQSAGEAILKVFAGILLTLDAIVYSLISWIYQIIMVLCNTDILSNTTAVEDLIHRLYVIIGVIMLFIVAYALLKALINPDEAMKGKQSPVVIIKNIVISIALIAFIPTIFDFALGFQRSILETGTLAKIILGSTNDSVSSENKNTIDNGGTMMASTILGAFLHPNINDGTCTLDPQTNTYDCQDFKVDEETDNYNEWWKELEESGNFLKIADLNEHVVEGKITYYWVISTIAGAFVLIILLGYCFDIALRVVKLAVFELIAPMPILCKIVPQEKASKVFTNWISATISTYLEVFIRLAVLFFGVFIMKVAVNNIPNIFLSAFNNGASLEIALIAEVLVVVGIIRFIHEAPGIIKDITGLDSNKYSVLKSAKQGLAMVAGGIVGRSPAAAYRAWNQAGEAKNLLDFSAIGNQYKRRIAKQEAKDKGAKWKDRAGDSIRKAFGWETKLEAANRRLERGLDMKGKTQSFKNDTDGAIYVLDENGKKIPIYQKNADGSFVLDANGNKVQAYEKDKNGNYVLDKDGNKILDFEKVVGTGEVVEMTDALANQLSHQKDKNAQIVSKLDERIRQIKEGKDLDQKYIDWRGKIKNKALEKINEGHNHIKKDLIYSYTDDNGIVHNENKGEMNYAAMLAFKQSRVNAGASAAEISALEQVIKKNEDDMWVEYSNWAIQEDVGGEIHTWYSQAKQTHDEMGMYDADSGRIFQYDKADLQSQMDKVVGSYTAKDGTVKDIKNSMAIFESSDIKIVDKVTGGALTYTDDSGVTHTKTSTRGFDKCAKANANGADTKIQHIEIQKTDANDSTKRIERMTKQLEESKTQLKSSEEYMRYKASDEANKINDSGKK